jgi:hypothetical protein
METRKEETPDPRKPVSPYLIGTGLVVLLALVTFVAAKYMKGGLGNFTGEEEHRGNLISGNCRSGAANVGVFAGRKDNIIIVAQPQHSDHPWPER